jgi:hypothetical protein
MLATGATISIAQADITYASSRRRSSSKLMAEMSANAASAASVSSTRRFTSSASDKGT